MKVKRGILFIDFNGVLSYKPFWASLSKKNHPLHHYYKPIEEFLWRGSNPEILIDWQTGKLTSEQVHRILEEKLGVPAKQILVAFKKDCRELDVSQKVLNKINNLRHLYHRILKTDNMDTFSRWTLPAHPELIESFEEIHCSWNLGFLKKSDGGEHFKKIAASKGFSMQQSYLVEDSISICKLFESLGGKAFNTKTEMEVLRALKELERY